jgi:hypothetical protein
MRREGITGGDPRLELEQLVGTIDVAGLEQSECSTAATEGAGDTDGIARLCAVPRDW